MPEMPWRPRSLQARQVLAASVGLLAFLALAGYALDRAFADTARDNLHQRLQSYALAYAGAIEVMRDGSLYVPEVAPDPRFNRPGGGLYAEVVMPGGHWQSPSAQGPVLPDGPMLEARRQRFEGPLRSAEIDGSAGQVYRYGRGFVWEARGGEPELPFTIYVMEDAEAVAGQLRIFRRALWGYLGGAGLVLLLLQAVILRWSLWPLRRVIAELKRVQRGAAQGMSEQHPRELEPLTDSINAFIDSERQNRERQRNTLADLAHSLKTPLAVLRSRLDNDAAPEVLREELNSQLQRMGDLVTYQLARAASGGHALFAKPVPIDLHAEQIVRGLEKVYAAKGVLCEFEIDAAASFHGEPGDLQELLGNLLENAFKWARGRVLLVAASTAATSGRRPGLRLSVEDDGPGIPPERVKSLLQRGVRGDERVQGHGIGLAIVQDIVRDYRGTLEVETSVELGGARFVVVLPPRL